MRRTGQVEAARASLAPLMAMPHRRQGRFRLVQHGAVSACIPLSLDLNRLTDAAIAERPLPAPPGATRCWALRLALAFRQDLWRRLRAMRGLAPAVVVQIGEGCATATALACLLDGAAASPVVLDALDEIFDDAALRRNRVWADRALRRQ